MGLCGYWREWIGGRCGLWCAAPWIQGIEGAEAWATFQALLITLPSPSRYWPDCLPVHLATQKGPEVALDPKNVLARVHGMIMTALEDTPADVVGWMPSHLTIKDLELQMARESDGTLVDERDLEANKLVDTFPKLAVEFHRVSKEEVRMWTEQMERVKARLIWIGIATDAANDLTT